MNDLKIITSRLELIPLRADQLIKYLDQEDAFNKEVGLTSRVILTDILKRAINLKLTNLVQTKTEEHPWLTYWLIKVPPDGFGAGLIGFKGVPDLKGEVEIGYGIDPDFQNKGFMTEAVLGLIGWAFEDPRCKQIVAPNTKRTNLASNRVLEKAGMQIYAESADSLSWVLDKSWKESHE